MSNEEKFEVNEESSFNEEYEEKLIDNVTDYLGISDDKIRENISSCKPGTDAIPEDDSESDIPSEISEEKCTNEKTENPEIDVAEFRRNIKNEASKLNKSYSIKLNAEEFNNDKYTTMLVGCALIPRDAIRAQEELGELLDTSKFIEITADVEGYDVKNSGVDNSKIHGVSEQVVALHKANNLFKHIFLDLHDTNFKFSSILPNTISFLSKYSSMMSTIGETKLIQSFIGKCIILLNTKTEDALRTPLSNNVHPELIHLLTEDIKSISDSIGRQGSRIQSLWLVFINGLFSRDNKGAVYKNDGYKVLNNRLLACYGRDPSVTNTFGLLEHFFGTMLKSYPPSIICDYFYSLRSVFIIARLVTIYQLTNLHIDKSIDEVASDLRLIGMIGSIIYESLFNSMRTLYRTLPRINGEEPSSELTGYLYSHTIFGGQYQLLRAVEKSLPALAWVITQRR